MTKRNTLFLWIAMLLFATNILAVDLINEGFSSGATAPAGWTFTSIGGTYTSAGNFGAASPSLKLDATNDAATTPIFSNPGQLSFWIKGQTTNASSKLTVEQYYGSAWVVIEDIMPLPTTGTTKTYTLNSAATQVRFTYTKSSGNLAFDDVVITQGSETTIPTAPVAIAASGISTTGFTANWNASSGAVDYRLDVATNTGFTAYVTGFQDLTVSGTSQTVTGLTANTTYYYRVRAVNTAGTSTSSNTITVTTSSSTPTVPSAPVATTASGISTTGFTANWSASSGAESYKLDLATNAGFTAWVTGYNDLTVSGTSKAITGLSANTTYYYRVRAVNTAGTSGNSNTITTTTSAVTDPYGGYYDSVSGLSGTSLFNGLHTLISTNTNSSYDGAKTQLFQTIDNVSGVVRCVYTGHDYTVSSGYNGSSSPNTEHTFAQSWFSSSESSIKKADLHHLFATDSTVNSSRGNLPFGVVANHSSATTFASYNNYHSYRGANSNGATVFEPADQHKGDLARALLYFYVRYNQPPSYDGVDMLSTLLTWNAADPVDAAELTRNTAIKNYQNNRNPFVDHPEYISSIWGGSSTTTTVQFAPTSMSVSESTGTIQLTVSISNPSSSTATQATVSLLSGDASDVNNFSSAVVTFPANSSTSQTVNVTITNDTLIEGNETIVFGLSNVSGGNQATIGTGNDFSLSILDNDIPTAVAIAASNVLGSSFTANWNALSGVSDYELDVATDNSFSQYVTGYEGLLVTGTNQSVAGLNSNTSYYYRVRANVNGTAGTNSNTITVATAFVNNPPTVSSIVATPSAPTPTDAVNVSATITDGEGTIQTAQVLWGTTSGSLTNTIPMSASGSTYTTTSAIPVQTVGTTVYFKVRAVDNLNAETLSTEQSYTVATTSVILSENFSGFTTNNGSADRSASLNSYLQTAGWTGTAIYEMSGYAKLGSGSAKGLITTPAINLSGNSGNATLSFDLGQYGSDTNKYVQVFQDPGTGTFTQVGSDIAIPATMVTQQVSITGGTSSTKIRIAAKLASNNRFYLDNVSISGGGGVVTPTITLNPSLLDFGTVAVNGTSTEKTYTVTGTNLSNNITVTAPTGFEVSLTSGTNYGQSLTLTPASGSVPNTTIYARFKPTAIQTYTDAITHVSTGATQQDLVVGGQGAIVNTPPVITNVAITPVAPTPTDVVSVSATITDSDGTIQTAEVQWGTSASSLSNTLTMTASSSTYTTATAIPVQANGSQVYYRVRAVDNSSAETFSTTSSYTVATPVVNPTSISENFAGFTADAGSTDRSSNLNDYLQNTGWTGSKIYEMVGYAKLGSSSAMGYIVTPALDLSANSGVATLSFDLGQYGSDASKYVQVFQDPGTGTYTQVGSDIAIPTTLTPQTVNVPNCTSNTKIKIAAKLASGNRFYLDNIVVSSGSVATPVISVTASSLTFVSTVAHTVTAEQTYQVSGSDLTSAINISAPAGFEVSTTSGSGFGSSVSLTPVSGAVNAQTVYVRFAPTAIQSYSGNITHTSTNAEEKVVAVSGTGTAPTGVITIVSDTDPLDFSTEVGTPSAIQGYLIEGTGFTGSVTITAPAGFEVSTSATEGFGSSISVANDYSEYIFVRFNPTTPGTVTGAISHSSLLAQTSTLGVRGTATGEAIIVKDLFISEYVEGSSSNKAIELFNPKDSAIDLSQYSIKLGANGNSWGTTSFTLSGSLASHGTYVIVNPSASTAMLAVKDTTNTITNFNGNDVVGLFKSGVLIDVIGSYLSNPAGGWDVAGVTTATANHTLIRKDSITHGDSLWTASAGTDTTNSEWLVQDNDYITNLGLHSYNPGGVTTIDTPTGLAITVEGSNIKLTWTAVTGAGQYKVWASDTVNGTYSVVGTSSTPAITLSNAAQSGKKFYYVTADSAVAKQRNNK